MGARRESDYEKARRLAQQAINQVRNPQEKQKLAQSLGLNVSPRGVITGGAHLERSTYSRLATALSSSVEKSSNPRAAASGATQINIPKFQEALGETPAEEYARKQAEAREYEQRPFKELQQAEEALRGQQEAYQRQLQEQQRVQAQVQAEVAAAEQEARIAGKRSAATSARLRSQSMIEQSRLQQGQAGVVQAAQAQQRRQPGTTVGQPGRARTQVRSGLGIGGYGGTRAGRVTATGLNI